jgi:uncharacterized membrane protein YkgB
MGTVTTVSLGIQLVRLVQLLVFIRIFTFRAVPHARHVVEQLENTFPRYSIMYNSAAAAHSECVHSKAERSYAP